MIIVPVYKLHPQNIPLIYYFVLYYNIYFFLFAIGYKSNFLFHVDQKCLIKLTKKDIGSMQLWKSMLQTILLSNFL